ncbi:DUF2073 domain-containing protein [Candidatus Woesearchaeota archaeon]|nr:DUF2073 domain-containing protein [Candidatus Woesearchaeota archaeon]
MLTLQFIPFSELSGLSPERRLKRILDVVKEDKILVLEGKLAKEEEAELIKATMESINGRFKGIEISVVSSGKKEEGIIRKLQRGLVEAISGARQGITIIGPATIIREIRKDPDKVQLLTVEARRNGRNGIKRRRKK